MKKLIICLLLLCSCSSQNQNVEVTKKVYENKSDILSIQMQKIETDEAMKEIDSEIKNKTCKDCGYRYTCEDSTTFDPDIDNMGCEYKGVMLPPETGK